ncbi:MAG: histidine phosphatase family protein [Pseudomonadota bacterium]
MRIVLMRHGKPSLSPQKAVSSLNFKNWIDAYNSAELCENLKPTKQTIDIVKTCNTVLCSHLPRSVNSANILGVEKVHCIEHKLREMEMPWGHLTHIKIKPAYWALIFRILWFFGYAKNSESFKEAKLRAGEAALLLEATAKEKSSVLFVGHGMLNRYIAKSLVRKGWQVKKKVGSRYWEFGVFERET